MIVRLCIEIRQNMAVLLNLQLEFDFEQGGGGHLGNWRRTVGDAFFGLSRYSFVCVPNSIQIRS
jgi:hypothetical protein